MPDRSEPDGRQFDLRLVPAALSAWAATAAAIVWPVGPILAGVCAGVAVGWGLARWRFGAVFPVLRVAAVGVLGVAAVGAGFGVAAGLRHDAVGQHPLGQRFGTTVSVTVAAQEGPRPAPGGRVMFSAGLLGLDGGESSGAVTVFGPAVGFADLVAGQPATFRAAVSRPRRHDLTVAVLTAVSRPAVGRPGVVQRVAKAVRTGFAAIAREALPTDQAAVLPGLVLGDTAAVPPGVTSEFRTAGLTHLTAVSGANVTIVCGAMLLSAVLIGPRAAVALAALALAAFVVVVQPGASVLRAAVMGAIGLLAVLSARRRQAVPVLAATVIALMVFAPRLAVDVGFALSVSATAALVVLAPAWSARLVARGWPKAVADAASIALAAQLVTAPLVAAVSGRFSLIGVVANLAVAVVIPPITLLGTAAAALGGLWPGFAGLLIRFTGPELWWVLEVAHAAASVPGAAIAVPKGWLGLAAVGGCTVASVALWPRRWFRRASAMALLCVLAWSVSGYVGPP